MTPEEVLQMELAKYRSALTHLQEAFDAKAIPEWIYNERKSNLEILIQQFKDAIQTLKIFGQ